MMKRYLPDETATIAFARQLAQCLEFPLTMTFHGEIGAGKTMLIRALLRALGVTDRIKSPTYALVESYEVQGQPIHHFDLYRIQDESELEYIGFNEYFSDDALCCIEWPERAPDSIPSVDLRLELAMEKEGRQLGIEALTVKGEKLLSHVADEK